MTTWKQTLIVSFWIVFGAVMLWGANRAGFLSPQPGHASSAALQVDFPEVYQLWKKGEAIFVDARSPSAFAQGHIPGAVNVPVNNVKRWVSVLPAQRHVRLVTYCGSVECPNGYQLMQTLLGYGYRRVRFFPRGMRGWQVLGLPVEKGNPKQTAD